jgi:sugar lactone lactonase YvrE
MFRFLAAIGFAFVAVAVASTAAGQMQYPLAVAAAQDGTIYVADRHLPGIWKITDGKPTLFFEGSKNYRTPLNAVRCLAFDRSGALLAGDSATREVYRMSESGEPTPLANGGIGMPMSVAVNSRGELLVADLELHRIWKVVAGGGKPELLAEVNAPRGVCVDKEDNLWVVSHGKNQLVRIDPAGKLETVVEGRPFQFPHHLVLSPDKTAFIADGYAKAIWKVPPGGKPEMLVSGEPLANPVGLAWRGDALLVADPKVNAVFEVTLDGKITKMELQAGD